LLSSVFGAEKLPSDPASPWVVFFARVGVGQWFRYLTGIVEIAGGVLVLIPWTVTLGLAVLACTMLGAVLTLVFVLGQPADTIMSGGILIGLVVFWRSRRTR
jgi:uncharacterized membrane protein YphA (DoxX/SURF4 family)